MNISFLRNSQAENSFFLLNIIAWVLVFLIVGSSLFLFFAEEDLLISEVTAHKPAPKSLNFEAIGTGPLALNGSERSTLAAYVEQKFQFLGLSSRPDVEERLFCFGVKDSEDRRIVKEGEKVFLDLKSLPSGGIESLKFTKHGTGIWISPHFLDAERALFKIGELEGQEVEGILHLAKGVEGNLKNNPAFLSLASAKWWGKDLFFELYGGTEYKPLSQKQKVELAFEEDLYILYAGVGDYFVFHKGKWQMLVNFSSQMPKAPIAVVKEIGQQLVMEIWDENGFPLSEVKLRQSKSNEKPLNEKFLSSPKLRSSKQVSLVLDKQRMIIKEGDWVLKTKNGWYRLKSLSEIESYLKHEMMGDLFVFDGVESNQLKGHLFNEMRTQIQPLTISLTTDNTRGRRS